MSSQYQTQGQRQRGPWQCKPWHWAMMEVHKGPDDHLINPNQPHQQYKDGPKATDRHLSLWDLVSLGIGGTIGSGMFVLSGIIAKEYAGKSTPLSFALSGVATLLSGLSFAEWAGRFPAAGSTYTYTILTLGEYPAVLAAACLTLEYGVSGAAVAKSWGLKVVEYMFLSSSLSSFYAALLAGVLSLACTVLLSKGVQESKRVTNFFTTLKVGLVLFMIVGGAWVALNTPLPASENNGQLEEEEPYFSKGVSGTLRGATSSFFAYLGYDEVCCVAREAKHPRKDLPRAVLWTILSVCVLYIGGAWSLVSMVPNTSEYISETSGFPSAFSYRGVEWAAQLTAIGEIITLPVVVLISLMAQPRLFAAVSQDGLLPATWFQYQSEPFLYTYSNWICGIPMTLLAMFVPLQSLDDGISVGILVAFNMTNSALVMCKCQSNIQSHLLAFHIISLTMALWLRYLSSWTWTMLPIFITLGYAMWIQCFVSVPQSSFASHLRQLSGGRVTTTAHHKHSLEAGMGEENDLKYFETPLVPLIPLLGIALNWYLVSQLEWTGLLTLLIYLGMVSLWYFGYCTRNTPSWEACHWQGSELLGEDENDEMEVNSFLQERNGEQGPMLLREISMPKR